MTSYQLADGNILKAGQTDGVILPLTSLSLVLPAHNEVLNLPKVLEQACAVGKQIASSFEVILVDDGSSDGSSGVARRTCDMLGLPITVIRHEKKSGYGKTVGDGLRAAQSDYVAFTDSDGQFDLAEFAELAPHLDGTVMVAGFRRHRQDAAMRSFVSFVFNTLLFVLYGLRVRDVDCAMKIMRRDFVQGARLEAKSALINAELFWKAKKAGFRIVQIPVTHLPRVAGVRSGARPRAILRAIKEVIIFRFRLRNWTFTAANAKEES